MDDQTSHAVPLWLWRQSELSPGPRCAVGLFKKIHPRKNTTDIKYKKKTEKGEETKGGRKIEKISNKGENGKLNKTDIKGKNRHKKQHKHKPFPWQGWNKIWKLKVGGKRKTSREKTKLRKRK